MRKMVMKEGCKEGEREGGKGGEERREGGKEAERGVLVVPTLRGVTVHRMLMMLLDFSWPSWGCFLRNNRLLLGTGDGEEEKQSETHVRTCSEMFIIQTLSFSLLLCSSTCKQCFHFAF